jgi:cell division septation protein DedD
MDVWKVQASAALAEADPVLRDHFETLFTSSVPRHGADHVSNSTPTPTSTPTSTSTSTSTSSTSTPVPTQAQAQAVSKAIEKWTVELQMLKEMGFASATHEHVPLLEQHCRVPGSSRETVNKEGMHAVLEVMLLDL